MAQEALTPFQEHIINEEQRSNDGCCLFLTMGSGKTRVALELIKKFEATRVLIISKSKIVKDTWPNQIEHWGLGYFHYECLANTPAVEQTERLRAGVAECTIVGTNFESFGSSIAIKNRPKRVDLANSPLLQAYESINWDIVIIDESTCIKDPTSKVSLAMLNLAYNLPNAYIMCLTGTPNPEATIDFYTQISVVDRGKRFGESFIAWRDKYFYKTNYDFNWKPFPFGPEGKSINQVITDLCKDMCYVITAEDLSKVLQIPPRHNTDVLFKLSDTTMGYYKQMKANVISMPNEDITAVNAAVVVSKLLQISSGFVYANGDTKLRKPYFLGDEKIKALIKLLNKIEGKVIVCYNFQASLDTLTLYLGMYDIEYALASDISEKEFATSKTIKVLLLQPASGAYGSNYQEDCHNMIWYEIQFSGEKFLQTEGRIHRQGQRLECNFYYLIGEGTYDKMARDKTRDKNSNALAILKAIKKAQRKVMPKDDTDLIRDYFILDDMLR